MLANRVYPSLIHHRRFARNGMVPDAKFAKALVRAQNHVMAYRRKTFMTSSTLTYSSLNSSRTMHRFRCHAGYGATSIEFRLGLGRDNTGSSGSVDPRVEIDVTEAGGATTTYTVHYGLNHVDVPANAPNECARHAVSAPVTANTTYEVAIRVVDYARILWCSAFEKASNIIDANTGYFISDSPSAFFPIYDNFRKTQLQGLSELWKRNGSHLLSWTGSGTTTSPTFTSTTWTNVIDSTTAVASSSAGYYLGDTGLSLEQHCRISTPTTLNVVFAAHGSCAGGSTGEVRLQDSTGTRISLTGIGSTSQWYTTTTSFANVTTLGKLDLQARVAAGGSTLTLNAVSMYCYVA